MTKWKARKIVTKGVRDACEHCDHFEYCAHPVAIEFKIRFGWYERKKEKQSKKEVLIECEYAENKSKTVNLPEIVSGLTEHKISRFEDYEICLYSNKEFQIVGFIYIVGFEHRKGARYFLYPLYIDGFCWSHKHIYKEVISDWGKFQDFDYRLENWIEEHDEELRRCFEDMDMGKDPRYF